MFSRFDAAVLEIINLCRRHAKNKTQCNKKEKQENDADNRHNATMHIIFIMQPCMPDSINVTELKQAMASKIMQGHFVNNIPINDPIYAYFLNSRFVIDQ